MISNLRMKRLVIAMGLCALCSVASIATQAAGRDAAVSNATVALHPAVALSNGDKVVGLLDVSQPLHVVVTLKLQNEQQLDAYIAKPGFRPLTSGQFQMLYAPTAAQAQAVVDYLNKAGFSNVKVSAGNALVEADGRADTAQAAFNTSLVHVKTHDGRDAFANSSAVQIPANLHDVVHAVLGLQNVHIAHAATRHYDPIAAHAMKWQAQAATEQGLAHQPSDFPAIYGASGMPNVTSVAVGSISAGPMANVRKDLASVDPGVTVILKGNTAVGNGSGTNSGDDEFDLDSQDIIAFTGVKQYYFYVANSTSDADLETDYAQVVSDNLLKAIDVSLYQCEIDVHDSGSMAAMDATFKQGVAQGQTFFVSAGDVGSNECDRNPSAAAYPASSPYVTAVGGTELWTGPNTVWQSETVWDDLNSTGGSPSIYEPIPSWQQGVPGISNQTYRGVPDIAFDADPTTGALVTVDGSIQQIGGTSLSAPLAVGMWAHVLQAEGTNLGFASPILYKIAQLSQFDYYSGFNDVISGTNTGYTAAPGWDYTTGWGSVNASQFAGLYADNNVSASAPLVSFGTLPALQVTTPNPGTTHTPGDFNGDGISDIAWFNPWLSQVGIWNMTAEVPGFNGGFVTRTGLSSYNVTPGYFIGAVGDFNNDGYADLVFTSANRDLWLWTNNQHGGWTSSRINNTSYPSQWQLIGAGDVDGDGYDDLLWLDPSECKFGYWTMNGATVTGYHTMDVACGYYPISIGYYTPSNRLSIIWTSAAKDLYIWDSNGDGTFKKYNLTSSLPANSEVISFGGGYQGQNIGLREYALDTNGSYDLAHGMLVSRSFDANNNQTGIQVSNVYTGYLNRHHVGAAGFLIAGNGVNDAGVYDIDPYQMLIGTGGLLNTSSPQYTGSASASPGIDGFTGYGDMWTYPAGWWVIGAPFNTTFAPPWQ